MTHTTTTYKANPGETLSGIALRFYGNPHDWRVIAEANSLTKDHIIKPITLHLPDHTQLCNRLRRTAANAPLLFEFVHNTADTSNTYVGQIKRVAGLNAFRHYRWIKNAPRLNTAGNLRGMVVSKTWASAFHIAETTTEVLDHVAIVSGLALNLYRASHQIEAIAQSNDDGYTKTAKVSSQVSAIIIRTLLSGIPDATHLIVGGVEKYGGVNSNSKWGKRLNSIDAKVSTSFETVMDGGQLYSFITNHLVIR